MNSKYKLFCAICACVFVILSFSSCVGIGDGALFDDVKTSEPDGERVVCTLELYGSNEHIKYDEAVFEGTEAETLLEYLESAKKPYIEGIDDDFMGYNYVIASFKQYDKDGNELPIYDTETGAKNTFYVRDNDNIDRGNMRVSFGRVPLGYLEGAYDKLFGYIEKYGASKGLFCSISTENAPHAMTRASGNSVYECFTMLSEGNYQTGMDRTDEVQTYIMLSFWGTEDATYYVYSDDYVQAFNSEPYTNALLFKPLGFLDGIYDKCLELYEDALDNVTDEERAAGMKLNCLQVKMKPNISRIFYLSDFEDIGGIYLKHLDLSDGRYTLVYFESCTREELKEKISVIEKLEVVDDVSEIFIIEEVYETAHAE